MVAAQNDKFDGELFDAYQMCIVLNCSYGCGCCWCLSINRIVGNAALLQLQLQLAKGL